MEQTTLYLLGSQAVGPDRLGRCSATWLHFSWCPKSSESCEVCACVCADIEGCIGLSLRGRVLQVHCPKERAEKDYLLSSRAFLLLSWPHRLYPYKGPSIEMVLPEYWNSVGESRGGESSEASVWHLKWQKWVIILGWFDWTGALESTIFYISKSMPTVRTGVDCLGSWLMCRMLLACIVIIVIIVITGVCLMILDTFHLNFTKLMSLQEGISFSTFQMENGQCTD